MSNRVHIPVMLRSVNYHNQLQLRVLAQRVIKVDSDSKRGQLIVEMKVPYKKKVEYDRSVLSASLSAVPLKRDVAVVITPETTDLRVPEIALTSSQYADQTYVNAYANDLNQQKRAGLCHITSEFFFKDA